MYFDMLDVITDVLPRFPPDGDSRFTITFPVPLAESVPVVAVTNTRCPLVPENVSAPFWPGEDNATGTAEPPGVIEPDPSAGTSDRVIVVVPVVVEYGVILIVYVPADDNVVVSMNFVLLEKMNPVEPISAELGLSSDTV
jgi:hypothetical protein